MPVLVVVTELASPVADVLAASLDLDVEVAAGRRHHVHTVPDGEGSRVRGRIGVGERVRWRATVFGMLPVIHSSVIDEVAPDDGDGGARFTDSMVRGAFRRFRHEHTLEALPHNRCRMTDRLAWTSPLGGLGRVADAVFVRRVLAGLLADRNGEIARRLGPPMPPQQH